MRARVTVAATAVIACVLMACVATLLVSMRVSMTSSAEEQARNRAEQIAEELRQGGLPTYVAGVSITNEGGLMPAIPSVIVPAGDGRYVQADIALRPVQDAISTLWTVLIPGFPLLLAIVAVTTWLAVGRALRPVEAVRAEVAEIAGHDLDRRVAVPPSRDEIAHLASTMNDTLDRLRDAVRRQQRFVADASHELRSPLAALRTQLELAAHGKGDWRQDSAAALQDAERLQRLADDLLYLARLDGAKPVAAQDVDLGQLVVEEITRRRRTDGIEVRPELATDVVVPGSASQLARLLTNLVDNAERHATGVVWIRVRSGVLEVHDDGPGLPPDRRDYVFEPFTRLDEARSRELGGAGLGLTIARDIVTAQGGTLTVEDSPLGGALFVARFRC